MIITFEERTFQVKLTQREKKIVDFIKSNGDSFLNDTITEFSEKEMLFMMKWL